MVYYNCTKEVQKGNDGNEKCLAVRRLCPLCWFNLCVLYSHVHYSELSALKEEINEKENFYCKIRSFYCTALSCRKGILLRRNLNECKANDTQ